MLNPGQVIDTVRNWGRGTGYCKLVITDTFIGDTYKGISTGMVIMCVLLRKDILESLWVQHSNQVRKTLSSSRATGTLVWYSGS